MNLLLLTPEKELFQGAVKAVKVPGENGQFEILAGHAPIVSALQEGNVRVVDAKGDESIFGIKGGFVEVLKDEISLLVSGVLE